MDLHIAFSSDNNYVAHLGVAIISLLENNRKLNIINIHVLDNNISFENKERLKEIVSNKASIYFYNRQPIASGRSLENYVRQHLLILFS